MPLMFFSEPEHIEALFSGKKRQTTRQPRKRPLKVGDLLTCYFKPRVHMSCRNCIIPLDGCPRGFDYNRRLHFGFSSLPATLMPCDKWRNVFGWATITDIQHHYRTWPENHREIVLDGYYALFGNMPEIALEKWAKDDGFVDLTDAHNWFMKSTKNNQWMFLDWDVIVFEPRWVV